MLEDLMLSNNKITGSVPSTIGFLDKLISINLSHNQIKGTIPTELSVLTELDLLHLHSNRFEGSANHIKHNPRSFITDCASTETASALVKCSGCTECCNIDGDCIVEENTWPAATLKSFVIPPSGVIVLFSILSSIVLILLLKILIRTEKKLPVLPYKVKSTFQEESVHSFYLSSDRKAWFLASFAVIIQLFVIILFIHSADNDYSGNLVSYSVSCPGDSRYCVDHSLTTLPGYILVGIILMIFVLPDIFDGMLLIYESTADPSKYL